MDLVICRYKEDLSWLKNLAPYIERVNRIWVYNKSSIPLKIPKIVQSKVIQVDIENVGREPFAYLYHITSQWDNLDARTLFLQGNPLEHIEKEKLFSPDCFERMMNEHNDLVYVDCGTNSIQELQVVTHKDFTRYSRLLNVKKGWDELFVGDFNKITQNTYKMCAQFEVKDTIIKQNSLNFYQDILERVVNDYFFQWYLEFFWEHLFAPAIFKKDLYFIKD